ncbi:MAG: 4-amino-4-deoxy-L-arabinose-phosphoundecaprenol flippase subunit ArnE [Enterobacterales bacterium endosymbiont of Blomia tropicalis]|uniref:4-amino-4-deoxy-L-arabinose-phosphoundecaprenol flippase subunit ArnE n=1 Tax=Mixta mediterraneensis TaxID=2758443 RepID=UPI0018738A43|nr:4-amino-4-deoxy-L-arabinose-phosphoundecaprenol flippase subunit ArnE [Mixta mediterraneensis]MBE5254228.1 EamA family transporter [Mixta mediterraneensis]MDL4915748.1 4-amino-4-deoxy-L-arabinose-phosphoundecaprenol flippase subunit ArnE [Mixta mediterraneensis]
MNLLLILLVSLLSCAAQLCQKQAAHLGARRGKKKLLMWIALSLLLLAVAMLLWLAVLHVTPVSVAYPMLSLNFVLVALAARLFWQETYTLQQWLGIIVMIAGVSLIGSHL